MKHNLIYGIILAIATLTATELSAQSSEGCDLHRTRLIPYPTANEAVEHSLAKQRYMQPITEWVTDSEGLLTGEFTYPFSKFSIGATLPESKRRIARLFLSSREIFVMLYSAAAWPFVELPATLPFTSTS